MIVHMQLELKDVPGSLLRALEPISSHGGNIVSVMHNRGEKENVIVQIVFKISDLSMLELIKSSLKSRHIRAAKIDLEGRKYYSRRIVDYLLVGHVIDSDIRDTVDRINKVALVSGIDVIMPSPEEKSSVLLHVEVDDKKALGLLESVKHICSQKKFLLVRSLN